MYDVFRTIYIAKHLKSQTSAKADDSQENVGQSDSLCQFVCSLLPANQTVSSRFQLEFNFDFGFWLDMGGFSLATAGLCSTLREKTKNLM